MRTVQKRIDAMPHLCHWLMFRCLSQSYMISHPGNSALQYVSRKLQRPKIQASQWHSYETNDYDSVLKHIYKDSNCIAVQINNLCCQVIAVSDASTLLKKKKNMLLPSAIQHQQLASERLKILLFCDGSSTNTRACTGHIC